MIISYFYFKFHSKLSLWYQLSNLPTVKIVFIENKIKREKMPKVMHRGCLLLRITPPYCIISSVTFLM
jgi:hypothetical protein